MTLPKNPPVGLVQAYDNFLRRQQRAVAVYFNETFRLHLIQFSGCLLIIFFHTLLMNTPLIERFENVFVDFLFRQRPPIAMDPAIVHIDIAEDGLQTFGRWPWPRYHHAALVHILKEWGAKKIVFDMIFSEPSTTFDDEALSQAIKEAGNVYLPVTLELSDGKETWVHAMPEFERFAKGVGHVNIFPDRDGTIRWVISPLTYNGETYSYLGAQVAFDYLGKDVLQDKLNVPKDKKGRIFINWVRMWKDSFRHYSFLDVIKSYAALREGRKPFITLDQIKGKICVIGLTAPGLTDIKVSSMEGTYPAVGVQTNIMNSILTGQFMRPVAPRWNTIALWVIGLLLSFSFFFSRQVPSLVVGLGFGLFWVLFAYWLFVEWGIWIYVINPLLLAASLFVFSAVFSIAVGKREQERLFTLLRELEISNEKLNVLDQSKSDFVAMLAHELKNPLTVLKGSLALTFDKAKDGKDEGQKKMLEVGKRNVDRLIRLVTDLLDLSKIEAGKMELKREEIDGVSLVKEVSATFERQILQKRMTLTENIPQNPRMFWGDRDKLTEVFFNLLSNAIKYTPEGGKIALKLEENEGGIRFEIADSGPGIPEDQREKIFDKYTRITAEKQEGTGLGLPIVKEIVELHKGKIWVESEPGQGSHFIFTIPRDFRDPPKAEGV